MQQPSPEQVPGRVTSARHHDLLPFPEARQVAPGIWKFTLPIPFPLRTVNMYALVADDGWTLVAAGIGTPDAPVAFAARLHTADLTIPPLHPYGPHHAHPYR